MVAGAGKRFWLLHLVGVTETAAVTFETEKPIIVEILKAAQVESVRTQRIDELRRKARVEMVAPYCTSHNIVMVWSKKEACMMKKRKWEAGATTYSSHPVP